MSRLRTMLLIAATALAVVAVGFAAVCLFAPTLDADGWGSANRELGALRQEIYLYTLDHHQLPGNTLPEILQTLDAARPANAPPTHYDHLRVNRDRWGNPFILTITPTELTLRSAGPDHLLHTGDDLSTTLDDLPDLLAAATQ